MYILYFIKKNTTEDQDTSILLKIFQEPAVDLCSQIRGGGRCLQLTCSKFSHWLKVD